MSKTRLHKRKNKKYTKTTKFLPKLKSVTRTNKQNSHLVKVFFEMLNMVKLYHWKTHSFAQHKATDELYQSLNEHIDKFIEILLGKGTKTSGYGDEERIKMMEKRIDLIDSKNVKDFKSRMFEYRNFLTDFNMHFDSKHDTDLLNIRDEILGDINQFLYLMSFDK
jgi:DNA-binding ferritin-like protein